MSSSRLLYFSTYLPTSKTAASETPIFEAYVSVPISGFKFAFSVPKLSVLCGTSPKSLLFYAQVLQLDKGAKEGASFTPGMRLKLGK